MKEDKLIRYESYNRKMVCKLFGEEEQFTKGAGTWGIQGIIDVPKCEDDYVFFVTFGRKISGHEFDEYITEDGVLTWQTQPNMNLENDKVKNFIKHNHNKNNIYLFLRTNKDDDYTYVGKLYYISHDKTKEKPVFFKWGIVDFDKTKVQNILKDIKIRPSNEKNEDYEYINDVNNSFNCGIDGEGDYESKPEKRQVPIKRDRKNVYPRNGKKAKNALKRADYKCEIDENHPTFIRKSVNVNYTEPHHLIPMEYQDKYEYSIDMKENIVSLCSNCHNQLHYGKGMEEKLERLFQKRKDHLKNIGIEITFEELLQMYL